MISRQIHLSRLKPLLARSPVVAVLGARQAGKTTLARQLLGRHGRGHWFDCEDEETVLRLAEPKQVLAPLKGLVVLDEAQYLPKLFPLLRVLADRPGRPARFLVLGSASPSLFKGVSESLAGRVAYYELDGFSSAEQKGDWKRVWLRGGFPPSALASTDSASLQWRRDFARSYLAKDLPQLGIRIPPSTLRRFWSMLAHVHGQVLNLSELSRAFGVGDMTVRHYLELLQDLYLVRLLKPWHENLSKRQVKAPKVYFRDSGIYHAVANIPNWSALEIHPAVGASWEGFAAQEVTLRLNAHADECHFWAAHTGAELDLMVVRGRERLGFEFKRSQKPSLTPSMRIAMKDLGLARLDVIYPGEETFSIADRIRAVGIGRLWKDVPA